MKTKDEILNELHDTGFIPAYCRTVNNNWYNDSDIEDVVMEVWLIVCSLSEEKLQSLYEQGKGINGVRRFCSGIISRQVKSYNSSTYKRYKRSVYNVVGDVSDLEKMERTDETI